MTQQQHGDESKEPCSEINMTEIEMTSNDGSVVAKEQEREPHLGKADPCCVTVTQPARASFESWYGKTVRERLEGRPT